MTSKALKFTSEGVQCELGQESYRSCLNLSKGACHSKVPGSDPTLIQSHVSEVVVKCEPIIDENEDTFNKQVDYICGICGENFVVPEDLKNHCRMHHGNESKPFKCYQCSFAFQHWSGNRGLKVHLESLLHSGSCVEGAVSGSRKISFTDGEMSFDDISSIEFCENVCGDCGVQYSSTNSYESHCRVHNSKEPYKCIECSLRFKKRIHLEEHRASHLLVKLHNCEECGKDYSFKWSLYMHSKVHGAKPQYKCLKCKQEFFSNSFLLSHEHLHEVDSDFEDNDMKPINIVDIGLQLCQVHINQVHPCPICEEERNDGCLSTVSTSVHECEDCDIGFASKDDLCHHLLLHKNPEAFKCEECDKVYERFVELREHVYSSHSDLEVHWCDDCAGSGYMNVSISAEGGWSTFQSQDGWTSSLENVEVHHEIPEDDACISDSDEDMREEFKTSVKRSRRKTSSKEGQSTMQTLPRESPKKRQASLLRDKAKRKSSTKALSVDKIQKPKKDNGPKHKRGVRQHSKRK